MSSFSHYGIGVRAEATLRRDRHFLPKGEIRALKVMSTYSCWSDYIDEIVFRISKYKPIHYHETCKKVADYLPVSFKQTSCYKSNRVTMYRSVEHSDWVRALAEMYYRGNIDLNLERCEYYSLSEYYKDRDKEQKAETQKNLLLFKFTGDYCQSCGKINNKKLYSANLNTENAFKNPLIKHLCWSCYMQYRKALKKMNEYKAIEKIRLEFLRESRKLNIISEGA